jgi:16S rRNA (cytosine967-C5)-methyltransferase
MTPSARVQAAIDLLEEIVVSARDGGAAADVLIQRYFKTRRYAGSKDRRAVRDLIYAAIRLCGERPASGRAAMLAVAQEDADLAALFDGSSHGPAPIVKGADPVADRGAMPRWLTPYLAEMIDAAELLATLDRAPLDVRVNRLRGDVAEAQAALPDAQPIPHIPQGLRLTEQAKVEDLPAYQSGLIDIQDAGSQAIGLLCAAQPGQNIIDLCAGGGGKTLALAADMANLGHIIAADINRARMQALPERAERAGATNIQLRLLNPKREMEALGDVAAQADLVLIDAPCSGSGTWRRNPESRWRLTPDRIVKLAQEQTRLLRLGAALVRPGGHLVYAVCSLFDAEGRNQIKRFLLENSGWAVDGNIHPALGRPHGDGSLLTPYHDGCDGFFMARLAYQPPQ